jgi:hypothetical protein
MDGHQACSERNADEQNESSLHGLNSQNGGCGKSVPDIAAAGFVTVQSSQTCLLV